MGYTNFPNGATSFGIPLLGGGGIPATPGKVFFVDYGNGSDANNGLSIEKPFKTVAYAYSQVRTNKYDVICLIGSSTHVLTEMLDVSKNRVIFIGLDGATGRSYGQSAKISLGVTTSATDIATVKNTGIRNVFNNIKFINDNTVAEGIYCFVDGGEYTEMVNCEVYKSTDMDVTGAADFVCNADSPNYVNCTFGSTATARSGAVIRPAILFTKGLAGSGKVTRDATFKECKIWINASNTANRFVYGANATDIERFALFDRCFFLNNGASANVPAQNVAFGATLTVGMVLLNDCVSLNAATAMSTTTGVFVNGSVPAAATTGIAVQAS
jgi:hypothetical protein